MTESTLVVIKIQSIFYHTHWTIIDKFLSSIVTQELSNEYEVLLHIGDCSPGPLLSEEALSFWGPELAKSNIRLEYTFFGANLGFAKGHNTLLKEIPAQSEQFLLVNPDAVLPFHLVSRLIDFGKKHPDYGIIEARQIPLEHPKAFDLVTLETGWATGACTVYKTEAFKRCGGFDEIFFMYCEDVDLSWRIRAAGYKVYYCPDTFIYHSKRMLANGIETSGAEHYYGLVSTLLLHAKYGRMDLNVPILQWARQNAEVMKAYDEALKRLNEASEAEKKVAQFNSDGTFADHRWKYEPFKLEV